MATSSIHIETAVDSFAVSVLRVALTFFSFIALQACQFVASFSPLRAIDIKDLVTTIGTLATLPLAIWGLYHLVYFWKSRHRKEAIIAHPLEKERAYLFAMRDYLEQLNRSLRFAEKEFTPPAGSLEEKEHVSLRFLFRNSASEDQIGLTPADIIPTAKRRFIKDIFAFLTRSKRPIILLGDPGSGKSVTMRHIAFEATLRELDKNPTWPKIPIYLQLGAYDQTDDGRPASVKEFIRYQLERVIPGGNQIVESLDTILTKGRALILLDSMDEMPSADFSERAKEIQRFMVEFGSINYVVVACRQREYSGSFPHSELIIQPFDSEKIERYLNKHWRLYSKDFLNPEAQDALFETYIALSRPNHPLFDFAKNPFSLNLLAKYFLKRGVLPQERTEVFQSYIDERLQRETERAKLTQGQRDIVLTVLKALAYGIIDSSLGTYISQEQCHTGIATLKPYSASQIDLAVNTAVAGSLMRREADGSMRFEHHRLVEYLAACYWDDRDKATELSLEPGHLKNPWWRETLVLRAGITRRADILIRELCLLIDVLGSPWRQKGTLSSRVLTDRLEYLVWLETLLACCRQRWRELPEGTRTVTLALAQPVLDNGGVLEHVRLTRSMAGLPIVDTASILTTMARSSSDWLVKEVFHSINPRDYTTPQFTLILRAFLDSTSYTDLFARMYRIKLPLFLLLRIGQQQAMLVRFFLLSLGIFALVGAYVLAFKFIEIPGLTGIPIPGLTGIPWKIVLVLLFGSIALLVAFLRVGGKTAGLMIVFAIAVPTCLSFFLPLRITIPVFIFISWLFVFTAEKFHCIRITNPLVGALSLVTVTSFSVRFSLFFLFATILNSAFWIYAPLPAWILIYLQLHPILDWLLALCICAAIGLLIEGALYSHERRAVNNLLMEDFRYANQERIDILLNLCLRELRTPRFLALNKKILERLTELPLAEVRVIEALGTMANNDAFFLKTDDLLEAIDRIDLRRRQKALQPQGAVETQG